MLVLSEYLGALLTEITNARLQADLESARIAQLYASHPLLQHMPIPRFRLPNVSLELPIAVEKVDRTPVTVPRLMELSALRHAIDGIIQLEMDQFKLELAPNLRKRLIETLNRLFESLKSARGLSAFDAIKASDATAADVTEAIKTSGKDDIELDPAFEPSLRRRFVAEFLKLQSPPLRVQILAVTTQLKEIAPPFALTRIRLTISEEGVEWTQTDPSDSFTKSLLPE